MNSPTRWVLSPVDARVHLLVVAGDLPWGVAKARCGEVLPPGSPCQHERPPWGEHRLCATCAQIDRRPASVPGDPWVPSPPVSSGGQPRGSGCSKVTRVVWVRCRVDEQLHLINPRATLRLAGGCAVAVCGALLVLPDVALRTAGTPCSTCLVVGST
ncbi:MAG: hypothetical protein JO063_12570 [Pseudonocardiales bacterium]|nr:hypothetical protein [Pseudonocardiales bacterium]MBV9030365.1 hypothetical protein [Pseudonocardiales bacterium]MBW0010924.1 hypothetical protein [Pseudonocardiales bacterium]